jgi:hypothetical protein
MNLDLIWRRCGALSAAVLVCMLLACNDGNLPGRNYQSNNDKVKENCSATELIGYWRSGQQLCRSLQKITPPKRGFSEGRKPTGVDYMVRWPVVDGVGLAFFAVVVTPMQLFTN